VISVHSWMLLSSSVVEVVEGALRSASGVADHRLSGHNGKISH
jgi:hypothetical protein